MTVKREPSLDLATALFRVNSIPEYFDMVISALSSLVPADHYNFLIINQATKTFYRHMSPSFPSEIFDGYARSGFRNDLVLKVALRRQPGDGVHFRALRREKEIPAGWARLFERVRRATAFRDSLSVLLHTSQDRSWGAGLTLWRFGSSPPFSKDEVRSFTAIGPLLAAAFESVWEDSLRRQEHDSLSAVCSNRGYVTLLVRKDGVLVSPNERALASLRSLCGRFRTEGLPRPFAKVLRRLLRELLADQAVPLAFREVDVEGKRCCLFVAPAPMGLKEAILYRVFIVCPSGLLDTALFSGAGFTENELKVLELLRRNVLVTEISQTLGVTEDLAKYYIKRLGKKLGATGGKGQIIERASGKSRELAVKEGLLECALGEVQEDRRGETQRRRRRSVQ